MKYPSLKPIPLILGTALALGSVAAQSSAFQMIDLTAGYQVAAVGEGKCGEGKCGEGKCGEGKGAMMMDANKDGKLSLEEHQTHWSAQFAKTDADKDGFVTEAEMMAMHAQSGDGKHVEGSCGEKQ